MLKNMVLSRIASFSLHFMLFAGRPDKTERVHEGDGAGAALKTPSFLWNSAEICWLFEGCSTSQRKPMSTCPSPTAPENEQNALGQHKRNTKKRKR